MGNLTREFKLNTISPIRGDIRPARYNNDEGNIVRVFFHFTRENHLGLRNIKKIISTFREKDLIILPGGSIKFNLTNMNNTLSEIYRNKNKDKKLLQKELIELRKHILYKLIPLVDKVQKHLKKNQTISFGTDFLSDHDYYGMPIQLGVIINSKGYDIYEKTYPTAKDHLISLGFNYTRKTKKNHKYRPLICNDGMIWAGRSEKGLKPKGIRDKAIVRFKKELKINSRKLFIDHIHEISYPNSGRSFTSSHKEFNTNHKGSQMVGVFASRRAGFLTKLMKSKKMPMKIKNLTPIQNETIEDYYIAA